MLNIISKLTFLHTIYSILLNFIPNFLIHNTSKYMAIKNIFIIYKGIFNYSSKNPLYFKNMHMIALHLNTINNPKYKFESKIFNLIKKNYKLLNKNIDYLPHWSLATLICLQSNNLDFNFSLYSERFLNDLKKSLT